MTWKPGVLVLAAAVGAGACASSGASATSPQTPPETASITRTGPVSTNESQPGVVPTGQELDVRLQNTLNSETAAVEQRFEATTVVDLEQNGRVLIPAGSVVKGVVSEVE